MASTVFIIYYGWIHINDLVIGYAAFAVFHDIQYFAIVWVYNNNLVKRQERTTKVLRTFFTTRTLPILAAYMLVSFAYGSINMMEGFLKSEQAINVIEIFVITSTILHYYFDGFIWKMKDRKNQANLGIKAEDGIKRIGARSIQSRLFRFSSYFRETGRQLAYFALPVAGLALFQFYWTADEADAREKMVELFPDLAGAHNNLGVFYSRLGDWDKASGEYRRALELDQGAYEAHKNLGLLYAQQGLLDEAHAHYQQAIDNKPEYVEALNSQGLVFMQRGQVDKAQQRFMEALAEFEYAPAYNNLGTAYLRDKNYMAAIRAYEKAIAVDRNNATHHFNLGLAFQKAVQNEGAVQAVDQAIALQPSYAKAYLSMALSYQRMGNLPAARQSLQRLLQVEPKNATAARLLARL